MSENTVTISIRRFKEYQCYGNLNNQCKKLNISHDMIRFWVDKGPIKTKRKAFIPKNHLELRIGNVKE